MMDKLEETKTFLSPTIITSIKVPNVFGLHSVKMLSVLVFVFNDSIVDVG